MIIKLLLFIDDEVFLFKSFKVFVGGWGFEFIFGIEWMGMIWMRF